MWRINVEYTRKRWMPLAMESVCGLSMSTQTAFVRYCNEESKENRRVYLRLCMMLYVVICVYISVMNNNKWSFMCNSLKIWAWNNVNKNLIVLHSLKIKQTNQMKLWTKCWNEKKYSIDTFVSVLLYTVNVSNIKSLHRWANLCCLFSFHI